MVSGLDAPQCGQLMTDSRIMARLQACRAPRCNPVRRTDMALRRRSPIGSRRPWQDEAALPRAVGGVGSARRVRRDAASWLTDVDGHVGVAVPLLLVTGRPICCCCAGPKSRAGRDAGRGPAPTRPVVTAAVIAPARIMPATAMPLGSAAVPARSYATVEMSDSTAARVNAAKSTRFGTARNCSCRCRKQTNGQEGFR